ncbi:MAG: tail fiber domain-containing protein [Blastomonas sp.]
MSELFFADLVQETSLTGGTGSLELSGAVPGHRSFAGAVPAETAFHYAICGIAEESEWEIGLGEIDSEGRLVRSPLASSNDGALVDLSGGLKSVALTVAADWFAGQDEGGSGGTVTIGDVDGLTEALASKQAAGDYAAASHGHSGFLQLDGSGNLAIGTATPAVRLHVVDGSTTTGTIRLGGNATYFGSLFYDYGAGALVLGTGAGQASFSANFQGHFYPGADAVGRCGLGSNRWDVIFAASGAISTSDERAKRDIGAIPDDWLDAWGAVEWQRYRFTSGQRWHAGLVAQQVHGAFAARGIDAFAIGLCCHDEWDEARDSDGGLVRAAGDRWGLRYEECLAVESAWQRRELKRLSERLAMLEAG